MKELKTYHITKKCEFCKKEFESLIKRNQRFCCGKCSSQFTSNDADRLKKIKKTKLERYGSESYVNSEKAKKTCLDKYGVDNVSKSKDVIEKIKTTNKEKFGVEWSFQSDEIKLKIKSTNIERYGVENPSQSKTIRDKVIETVSEKYGCDNVFKNELIKKKIYDTNMTLYGSKIPVNSPQLKETSKIKRRETALNELRSNPKISEHVSILIEDGKYISTDRENKYKFKCNKCNTVFEDHVDGGHIPRCLICNPYINGYSKMEKEVFEYLKGLLQSEEVKEKDRSLINGELDIVIPSKKLAIEFNGIYWHAELSGNKSKLYHLNKTIECEKKGFQLIHIFEDEWVKKESIVKNRLKHIIGKNTECRIYARNCKVVEINSKCCNEFLEKHHLQGKCNSSIRLALTHNNEIVSVMTFGKLRPSLGNTHRVGEYEMYRHCSSTSISGGPSKLLNYFIKSYSPNKIISYSDRRWSTGGLYKKLGFITEKNTPPNYFYIKYGQVDRFHRYNFTKHLLKKKLKNYNESISEWENMKLNGYDRIWDCGHGKWILIA